MCQYLYNDEVPAKSLALLPRALARGLKWRDNLGILNPEPGGLKPHGMWVSFSFHDLKVVAK
jgi:hypothetical protein